MRRLVLLLAAPVAVLGLASFSTTTVRASSVLVVDDNHAQCPTAGFTTISAAVAAAASGDTIKVCAGIYPETVMVDKTLTFEGAKMGVDARSNRGGLAKESVVDSINGAFIIAGTVNGVTINGFTIQGAGSDAVGADGIEAFGGSSGLTVVNNIVRDNLEGINFQNPDPNQPAMIQHNNFINNNNGTTAEGGTGVFISNGPANSTSILQNRFTGHRETAINFAGSSNHSVGLVVDGNNSQNDSTFVVATNSDNAVIDSNTVSFTGSTNGTGILDFGGNNNLRIMYNTIKGGNGSGTSGINLANYSYSGVSVGTTVTGNQVSGRYNGIRIHFGPPSNTSALINGNSVIGATNVGILVEEGSSGNAITHNSVSRTAGRYACQDLTTGPLTAGTANTWTRDSGGTGPSSPPGICSQS